MKERSAKRLVRESALLCRAGSHPAACPCASRPRAADGHARAAAARRAGARLPGLACDRSSCACALRARLRRRLAFRWRDDLVKDRIQEAARSCDTTDPATFLLYTKGIFPHPGDEVPRPCRDGGITTSREGEPDRDDTALAGNIFMDGSCQRHVIRELYRASWGFTAHGDDGSKVVNAHGPIWGPLPRRARLGSTGPSKLPLSAL